MSSRRQHIDAIVSRRGCSYTGTSKPDLTLQRAGAERCPDRPATTASRTPQRDPQAGASLCTKCSLKVVCIRYTHAEAYSISIQHKQSYLDCHSTLSINCLQTGTLLSKLAECIGDTDKAVRAALKELLSSVILPQLKGDMLGPFVPLVMAHLFSALTSLSEPVRSAPPW